MKKVGGNSESSQHKGGRFGGNDLIKNKKKMKKNTQRLGGNGGGLSLESFVNAKTRSGCYNPSLIRKQREFYKNAKYVNKYKKSLKQLEQQSVPSTTVRPLEGGSEVEEGNYVNRQSKHKTHSGRSLKEVYEKKREEKEKAMVEREAVIQAKKQEIQQVEARRRALKEKMYKRNKSGQPVMKYRIQHLLEAIQGGSTS